ncbi:MAG TPA: DUF2934 domain-containing protein [Verrucomicrobiae bacterium]|nr:DUF2934 domain-containing protein [Verrucomicrobiae bacterium]
MQTKSITKPRVTTPVTTQFAAVEKPKPAPTRDEIARRAYEIYLARGKAGGRETEDWYQAERELLGKTHRNN